MSPPDQVLLFMLITFCSLVLILALVALWLKWKGKI